MESEVDAAELVLEEEQLLGVVRPTGGSRSSRRSQSLAKVRMKAWKERCKPLN